MNNIFSAVILGIVEGITEFLPISSTGHLIILNQFVNFKGLSDGFTDMFNVVIQLGAILSVVIYFFKKLWPFVKEKQKRDEILGTWFKTIVGVIPAIIIGFFFEEYMEEKLFNPLVVSIALIIGGILLIFIERSKKIPKIHSIKEMDYKTVIFIGLFQCLAMIPGTSRSAATIIGALLLGLSRVTAAEYSFFLAIPTMFGASFYKLMKMGFSLSGGELITLISGFITAFIIALLVISVFMKFISKKNFLPFAYYRILLGMLVIFMLFV